MTLGLFLMALAPRLIYLFAVSNPENAGDGLYTDVYQHWQIAYLTKEIGLSRTPGSVYMGIRLLPV